MDNGCTDHIVITDAFLNFGPIQSVVRNTNGEAEKDEEGRNCVRTIYVYPQIEGNSNANSNKLHKSCFSLKMHGVGTKPQFRVRKELHTTPEGSSSKTNNLFYLPGSMLELDMISNSVKLEGARKWHRRLGQLNQANVFRNAQEIVGGLRDLCNMCIGQDHKELKNSS